MISLPAGLSHTPLEYQCSDTSLVTNETHITSELKHLWARNERLKHRQTHFVADGSDSIDRFVWFIPFGLSHQQCSEPGSQVMFEPKLYEVSRLISEITPDCNTTAGFYLQ